MRKLEPNKFKKVYVPVTLKVSPEGNIRPMTITFDDHVYQIDRLRQCCRCHSTKVGGTGIRYTVVINNQTTYLFADDEGRWFVEAKTAGG